MEFLAMKQKAEAVSGRHKKIRPDAVVFEVKRQIQNKSILA